MPEDDFCLSATSFFFLRQGSLPLQPMFHVSWMMVPSMVYSPLQPPSIDQVHSGSIVIVVACWSDKVLQAVGCTMIRRSRDACLKRIAFSHVRSCLGHWAHNLKKLIQACINSHECSAHLPPALTSTREDAG